MTIDKAIFLDIDGVLALKNGYELPVSKWLWGMAYPFDIPCVEVLNTILRKTDAEIVLSSMWRVDYSSEELDQIFEWNKVLKNPIAITDWLVGYTRCAEIITFLKKNKVNKFVMIDDMDLDCHRDKFIKTKMNSGLNMSHMDRIVKLLNE